MPVRQHQQQGLWNFLDQSFKDYLRNICLPEEFEALPIVERVNLRNLWLEEEQNKLRRPAINKQHNNPNDRRNDAPAPLGVPMVISIESDEDMEVKTEDDPCSETATTRLGRSQGQSQLASRSSKSPTRGSKRHSKSKSMPESGLEQKDKSLSDTVARVPNKSRKADSNSSSSSRRKSSNATNTISTCARNKLKNGDLELQKSPPTTTPQPAWHWLMAPDGSPAMARGHPKRIVTPTPLRSSKRIKSKTGNFDLQKLPPATLRKPPPTNTPEGTKKYEQLLDERWMEMYDRLRNYKKCHEGSTRVPRHYPEDPQLACWVRNQRHICKQRVRRELLDAIGFEWKISQTKVQEKRTAEVQTETRTHVYKMFINPVTGVPQEYIGRIVSYDKSSGIYRIVYDDGDEEKMNEGQVQQHLKPTIPSQSPLSNTYTVDPLEGLSDMAKEYLASIQITTAEEFLSARTKEVAEHYPAWRMQKGKPPIKENGHRATITMWKRRVRHLAARVGATDLVQLNLGQHAIIPGPTSSGNTIKSEASVQAIVGDASDQGTSSSLDTKDFTQKCSTTILAKMVEMKENGILEVEESILLACTTCTHPRSQSFARAVQELRERNYIKKSPNCENPKYILTKTDLAWL